VRKQSAKFKSQRDKMRDSINKSTELYPSKIIVDGGKVIENID
jgi:hypothetical protein